jgi:hypothetical protein
VDFSAESLQNMRQQKDILKVTRKKNPNKDIIPGKPDFQK